jgi:hypothetical protein
MVSMKHQTVIDTLVLFTRCAATAHDLYEFCQYDIILSDGAPQQELGGFRSVQLIAACPIVLIPSLLHPSALSRQASCRLS